MPKTFTSAVMCYQAATMSNRKIMFTTYVDGRSLKRVTTNSFSLFLSGSSVTNGAKTREEQQQQFLFVCFFQHVSRNFAFFVCSFLVCLVDFYISNIRTTYSNSAPLTNQCAFPFSSLTVTKTRMTAIRASPPPSHHSISE